MRDMIERCLVLSRQARTESGATRDATLERLETALAAAGVSAGADAEASVGMAAATEEVAMLELDLAGYLTGWDAGAVQMFGYAPREALGQHVLFLYADDDEDGYIAELFAEHAATAVQRRSKDGAMIWVRLQLSPRYDASGVAVGMSVRMVRTEAALSASDKLKLHARIIEDSEQGMVIFDAHERIVSVNTAFSHITGYPADEAIGQTPALLRSGVHDDAFRAHVRAALQGAGSWRGEITGRRKNGELFPLSAMISVVRDDGGRITHTFSLFSDISAHKDVEARMQRMANYDALTGLPNLYQLTQLVGQALAATRRSQQHGALLVVEITRVGAISDTLGHAVGDALLCEVARLFRLALREADVLARLDGYKFAVALLHIEQREHAAVVAKKLLAVLDAPLVIGAHRLQVCGHLGIAVYTDDATDVATLIRYAEVAMVRAAQPMESAFLFYSAEMNQRAKEHLRIESELRHALSNNELMLYYQPKVSLRSGRIVGAEALLRWRHPVRGLIAPGIFIPVAEQSGLILELGAWVLDEACRQVRAWQDEQLAMPPIAVNLSARQFDQLLPQRVAEVLARHQVQPDQINLEITESLLVRGAEQVIAIMNELVAMGMALALDDFGTGYSSLAYLKKFPISTLKIDRAFVIGLPDEENDCAIARAIVTLAQQLRQEIVAEGVETVEQMNFLRELGCDQLQGYLFSQPVAAPEFASMLRDGKRLAL